MLIDKVNLQHLISIRSFNPFRRVEEREREERETAPTPPPSDTGAETDGGQKRKWKQASDEDKELLFELLEEKDPEGVSQSLISSLLCCIAAYNVAPTPPNKTCQNYRKKSCKIPTALHHAPSSQCGRHLWMVPYACCNLNAIFFLQYIGKEPKEDKKDVRLVAKRKRRWNIILDAFNEEKRKNGEEPWSLKKLKDLRQVYFEFLQFQCMFEC